MSTRKYTPADVAKIRALAPTTTDLDVAAAMGWKFWKVAYVRQREGIPARTRIQFWTEERIAHAYRRYVRDGATSSVVADELGCGEHQVRRIAYKQGWARDPLIHHRNLAMAQAKLRREGRAVPPPPGGTAAPRQSSEGYGRLTTFIRPHPTQPLPPAPVGALCDRLTAELRVRPLPAPSLAALLGVNELAVNTTLRSLVQAGAVAEGAVPPSGARYRPFELVSP